MRLKRRHWDQLVAVDAVGPTEMIVPSGSSYLPMSIVDAGSNANSVKIRPTADKSNSSSVGGALYIDNSASVGVGLGVYSTQSAPTGNLAFFRANHASFSQRAVRVEHAGSGIGVDVNHTGTGIGLQVVGSGGATEGSKHAVAISLSNTGSTTSSALSVSSSNESHSALQVTGVETGRGTIKISHTGKADGSDANASAISIDLTTSGTACKGIYILASSGTTGTLIDCRSPNSSSFVFQVYQGQIILTAPNGDPGTSAMWNGSWNAYLNEAGNQLVFKAKYSGGTVKSGTVALA